MIRQHIPESLKGDRDFRWRGGDVSRIEGLTDAAFAFALTLMVVSLSVPTTYAELRAAILQVPAFAVCFVFLVWCWYMHYIFHRRFGFEGALAVTYNAAFLFVIMLYVYPLKFLATILINSVLGLDDALLPGGVPVPNLTPVEFRSLMFFYSGGVVAIFLLFYLMYAHAYRRRDELQLDAVERMITRGDMRAHMISGGIGVASLILAAIGGIAVPFSGLVYFLMGPAHGIHAAVTGRRVGRLKEQLGRS